MSKCNVLIPNLERRLDRWLTIRGILLGLGFPRCQVFRFLGFDGAKYDSPEAVQSDALKMYDSLYFERYMERHSKQLPAGVIASSWTFYAILKMIESEVLGSDPVLFLIDDMILRRRYNEILRDIKLLSADGGLRIVQYHVGCQDNFPMFKRVKCQIHAEFDRGIGGVCDWCLLFTPAGARAMIKLLDTDEWCAGRHLSHCLWRFAETQRQTGCYSLRLSWVAELLDCAYTSQINDRSQVTKPISFRTRGNRRLMWEEK